MYEIIELTSRSNYPAEVAQARLTATHSSACTAIKPVSVSGPLTSFALRRNSAERDVYLPGGKLCARNCRSQLTISLTRLYNYEVLINYYGQLLRSQLRNSAYQLAQKVVFRLLLRCQPRFKSE
jgi:hypothetical protein